MNGLKADPGWNPLLVVPPCDALTFKDICVAVGSVAEGSPWLVFWAMDTIRPVPGSTETMTFLTLEGSPVGT